MWLGLNSAEVRETGWNYTKATAVYFFKPSSLLKLEVGGVKRTVTAATLLQILEASPDLHHKVTVAKATAAGFAAIAAVPSLIVTIVMSIFFSIIGKFMQEEHLRGVKIIDEVAEFNAMIDRNIRGVHQIERGWVKRLRAFK
jgi:hypothetical protein